MKLMKSSGLQHVQEGFQTAPSPSVALPPLAIGGTITDFTDSGGQQYKIHTFSSTTSFVIYKKALTVDYVLVGGGGGGGNVGRAPTGPLFWNYYGGGGGVSYKTSVSLNKKTYTVGIGSGGGSYYYYHHGNYDRYVGSGGGSSFNDDSAGGGGAAKSDSNGSSARGSGTTIQANIFSSTAVTYGNPGKSDCGARSYNAGDGGDGSTTDCTQGGGGMSGILILRYKTWPGYAEAIDLLIQYSYIYSQAQMYWTPTTEMVGSQKVSDIITRLNKYIDMSGNFLTAFESPTTLLGGDTYTTLRDSLVPGVIMAIFNSIAYNANQLYTSLLSSLSGFTISDSDTVSALSASPPSYTTLSDSLNTIYKYIQLLPFKFQMVGWGLDSSNLNNSYLFSSNGSSWNEGGRQFGTTGSSNYRYGYCIVSNGLIAVVGSSTGIFYSTDNIIWTLSSSTSNVCMAIAWNGSYWLAGQGSNLVKSTDGKAWTSISTFTPQFTNYPISAIAWNTTSKKWFVANTVLYSSSDGITWITDTTCNFNYQNIGGYNVGCMGIACSPTKNVAIGGSQGLYSDQNGTSWTFINTPDLAGNNSTGILWDGSKFILGGKTSYYSSNGISWTSMSISIPVKFQFDGINYYYMSYNQKQSVFVYKSSDGINWSSAFASSTLMYSAFGFNVTKASYYDFIIQGMKSSLASMIATYNLTKTLVPASITIPASMNLTSTSDQANINAITKPFIVTNGTYSAYIPVLTELSTTASGQTYTVSASNTQTTHSANYAFGVSTASPNYWGTNTTPSVASPHWVQIVFLNPIIITGYRFNAKMNIKSMPSNFKLQACNDPSPNSSTVWTDLDTQTGNTQTAVDITLSVIPNAYTTYRLLITAVNLFGSSIFIYYMNFYTYSGILVNTKQDQLLQIYNKYKTANDSLQALLQAIKFKTTYENARKYISDTELAATTITTKTAIYTNGTYTESQIIEARRDILKTLIQKYYLINPTGAPVPAPASSLTIPTAPTVATSLSPTFSSDDVTNMTNTQLDSIETKFLTGSTALWPALMMSMRTYVSNYISTTYKNARGSVSTSSPNYLSDATLTRDAGYTSATLTSNQDASGVVRFIVNTSDSSGLTALTGFQLFATNPTSSVLYTAPSSTSGFTTITNNFSYSFRSGTNTIILTTSPTSGWVAGGTTDLRNTILSTGANPRSNDIIIQFPTLVNPTTVYAGLRGTGTVTGGFTISGANSVSGPWTNIFTISTLSLTSTGTLAINLGITTSDSYTFLRFQPTANIALISGVGYQGRYMSPTISSEYSLISQLYTIYKTYVDNIVQAVRQPALNQLSSFQTTYASLTQCLPTDVATNPQYASVYQAYQTSLAPSGAPSSTSSSDAIAIMGLTDASTISTYTTKYETAIRDLYNALRTKQISTLKNYNTLYTQYISFSTDTSLAAYTVGMAAPATQQGLTDDGSADLATVQGLPLATNTYTPTATDISGLSAICTLYNGTTGRYGILQIFLKTNIETFIRNYDKKYDSLSQQAKNANPYTTPLQPASPAGTGYLSVRITPQELLNLMVAYGGFATTPTLSTDTGAPAPATGTPPPSYKTTYSTARDQADALTVLLDFSTLIQDIARSKTLLIAIDSKDNSAINTVNQAISEYATNAYDSNIALAVRDKSTYQGHITSVLSLAAKNLQTIVSDYKTLYEAYESFRTDVGGQGFLQDLPALTDTAPSTDTVPELTYTVSTSEDYTADPVGSLSLYGSVTNYATFQSMRQTYADAYETLITTIRDNLNAFITSAQARITTLAPPSSIDSSSFGTLNQSSTSLQSLITTSSDTMANWFVTLFYTNTYVPGIRYIRSTQIPSTVATFATLCESLGTSQASRTVIKDAVPAINAMTTTLAIEFETAYTTWTGRGMQSATQKPETIATDKTTASDFARTTYLKLWSILLGEIHAFTKKSVQTAKYLQTWSQKATNQPVSVLFQGLPKTTTGLGQ